MALTKSQAAVWGAPPLMLTRSTLVLFTPFKPRCREPPDSCNSSRDPHDDMFPDLFNCPICGWHIIEAGGEGTWTWQGQFRGGERPLQARSCCADPRLTIISPHPTPPVYSSPGEGIVLTGVGRYAVAHAGTYIAPPDPAARWNDAGYNSPRAHQFGIMSQGYLNGRRGFALHESCWTLLVQAYHPAPVPHERLFDVLSSMPMAMTDDKTMDWGHGYGDLVFLRGETSYFPWEYLRFWSRGSQGGWFGTPYSVNPLAFSQVKRLLAEPPQTPPSRNPVPPSEASPPGHDPFDMVPEELCCAIAAYLPTNDLLNLRLASRSFWSIFDTQEFWASRFRGIGSERSWLYEAAQVLATPGNIRRHDWRWLYRRTAGARVEEWVKNRKRIWDLILPVVDLMDLSWSELPADLPAPWTAPYIPGSPAAPGRSSPGDLWLQASEVFGAADAGRTSHRYRGLLPS